MNSIQEKKDNNFGILGKLFEYIFTSCLTGYLDILMYSTMWVVAGYPVQGYIRRQPGRCAAAVAAVELMDPFWQPSVNILSASS